MKKIFMEIHKNLYIPDVKPLNLTLCSNICYTNEIYERPKVFQLQITQVVQNGTQVSGILQECLGLFQNFQSDPSTTLSDNPDVTCEKRPCLIGL